MTSQTTFLLGAWLRRLLPWARSPAGAAKRPDAGGAAPCVHGRSYPSARSSACPPRPRASWRTPFGYPLARGSTSLSLGFRGSRRCKAGPASHVAPAADCPSASRAQNTRERTRRPSPTRKSSRPPVRPKEQILLQGKINVSSTRVSNYTQICTTLGFELPSLPDSWTHGPLSAPGDGQRRPTARRRGNQELSPGRGRAPQPGLRLVHHTRQDWKQRPRAAERFAITSSGP